MSLFFRTFVVAMSLFATACATDDRTGGAQILQGANCKAPVWAQRMNGSEPTNEYYIERYEWKCPR